MTLLHIDAPSRQEPLRLWSGGRTAASAFIWLVLWALLALASAAVTAQTPPGKDLASVTTPLEREIETILDETGIPSISLALIQDGAVVWANAYGYANVGARVPATADTYYSTGSTFKFVTAAAVMQLVERGQLTLDTPLNEVVGPDLAIEGAGDVTVRHLLSHHSGLDAFASARRSKTEGPVTTVALWGRQASITPEELLSNTRRVAPPGIEFRYCNDCYGIAGFIVEKVSGQSYDEYVAEHVLQPLGVEIDQPSVPSPEVVEHLALPYGLSDNAPTPISQVRYDAFAAGDVYLKASDMARFVAAQLNGGEYQGRRILSSASCQEMRRQQFAGRGYGLGVQTASFDGHDVIHHTGGIPGFTSTMVAEPSTRQGVYIMANAGSSRALGQLARYAMQLMWDDEVEPSPSFASRSEVTVSSAVLDQYVGEYALTPDLRIEVSRVGERFFVQPTGRSRVEVFPTSHTDFSPRQGGASVTFGRDEEGGPVTHLLLVRSNGDQRANKVDKVAEVDAVARETASPEDLPAASTLLARHLDARGGRDALESPQTIEVTGKLAMAALGLEGTVLARFGRDRRFTSTVDMGTTGTIRQGYDGRVGWMISPRGAEVLRGTLLEQLKEEANWLADAEYERLYTDLQTVAREEFHGFDCFVVEVTSSAGEESKLYFERETGLARGREAMTVSAGGPTRVITVMRSYREFGDLLVPTETEVITPSQGGSHVFTVETVEYDTLERRAFELPPEIVEQVRRFSEPGAP